MTASELTQKPGEQSFLGQFPPLCRLRVGVVGTREGTVRNRNDIQPHGQEGMCFQEPGKWTENHMLRRSWNKTVCLSSNA